MSTPARLILVRPDQQPTPDANVRSIAHYIYAAITRVESDVMFAGNQFDGDLSALEDLLEIWYWFNPQSHIHRLVFWGGYPGSSDPDGTPWWLPLNIYLVVTGNPASAIDHYDAVLKQHTRLMKLRRRVWDRPFAEQIENKIPLDIRSSASSSERDEQPPDSSDSASNAAEWTATLMLVEYIKRIPSVPIPRAAMLLEVNERTIRNRILHGDLEGIPKRGTLWVTMRSIRKYLEANIYPTQHFNVWNEVLAVAEQQKAKTL